MPATLPTVSTAFALDRVTRHYGSVRALDDITLAFPRGNTSLLIGTSGSGKSTLLRLLLGLEWPDAGTVFAAGAALTRAHVPALRRQIGYVIQGGGLFPHLTALGNVALLPRHLGWTAARVYERARSLLELTHLPVDALQRFPAELSGGQRQRVALMRALMLDPPTLLLDEPLGALDPLVRHQLQDDLHAIFERLGKTVIMVTHDLAEAAFFGDRLILLRRGRVVQDGTLESFRRAPAEPFVTAFVAAQRTLPDMPA